jgi:hypothetical protein
VMIDKIISLQRVRYVAHNVFLPFGGETYNDNTVINVVIDDTNNYNYNLLVTFKKIINTFKSMKDSETYANKYCLTNKSFFSFMKEWTGEKTDNIERYSIRMYMKYGAKITHSKIPGELTIDILKGKRCNIDFELGLMWVNNAKMNYGLSLYITNIKVLN